MKQMLLESPSLSGILGFIGVLFCLVAGVLLVEMFAPIALSVKLIITFSVSLFLGLTFTLLPLYTYIEGYNTRDGYLREAYREIDSVNNALHRSRRYESPEWTSDRETIDDLDDDGEGNDGLRRLGIIQ